jgi:hypothetical protein
MVVCLTVEWNRKAGQNPPRVVVPSEEEEEDGCLFACLTTLSANTIAGYSIENRPPSEWNVEVLMFLNSTLSHLNPVHIHINY